MSQIRLAEILTASPRLMTVLETARDLGLSDWMIFSGGIYQTAWNALTGRDPDYGIKDYDLGYFDPADISYEAEDVVIRRVAAAFEPPLRDMIEVRNQARVHLWFEGHFKEPYEPLGSSAEALGRFVSPVFAVGVRLDAEDRMTIHAPFGLEDLFALRLRPNPTRMSPNFGKIAASAKARWPEIAVEG